MADCFDDEPTDAAKRADPVFLGIIGHRTDVTQTTLTERVLNPVLSVLGRVPEKVLLPEEGVSSIYISDWAETLKIPAFTYQCDWQRHAKRAKLFRDLRIQEESTHFIIFLNKRSEAHEKLAARLATRGYTVFTVHHDTWEVEELVVETLTDQRTRQSCQGSSRNPPSSSSAPAKRGRKPGTGKGPESRLGLQSADPGSQSTLTGLWAT